MCGRYAITLPPEAIRQLFQTHGELPNWPTYYNAAPTTALPVVRQAKDDGNHELVLMQWGLIPWFSKDGKPSYSTINARAEGIRTAAPYREPFSKGAPLHRAGIGIFRMDRAEERSTAALLHAGRWSADGARWPVGSLAEQGQVGDERDVHYRHNRAPQVRGTVPQSHAACPRADLWMTGEPEAAALMKPANEDALVSRPVSKAVGNVKNNGPELLA